MRTSFPLRLRFALRRRPLVRPSHLSDNLLRDIGLSRSTLDAAELLGPHRQSHKS